ncbi:MAG: molecular chaperone HtpG [Clostridia bacterium]|nr:molecular chaperone HtpG [Clostridia bacterium]
MRKKQFKAESKKLLDMMINSIYTHKEIFLRELISNASDAMDKLYFHSLQNNLALNRSDLFVFITPDRENRTLTVSDNGIGMTADELENNLGTIAKSGSFDFKNENGDEEKPEDVDIIGQFGVGFYSAFMVSDRIEVVSKAFGADTANKWTSEGADGYTVEPCEMEGSGTVIKLFLKEDTEDDDYSRFLEEGRIRELVRKYSDYIRYPIKMDCEHRRLKEGSEDEYETVTETAVLNSMVPIWKKNRNEVTADEYSNFYKDKFFDYEEPAKVIHANMEGQVAYSALLFIPRRVPFDYYTKNYEKGLQLYSNGVMIMDKCADLLPDYFSFVKGIVDSEDLSLNISREMLQHDAQLKLIAKSLEKKIHSELLKLMKDSRATYETVYKAFGTQMKFGIYNSFGAKNDVLSDLIMFCSSNEKKYVTLKEYVGRMKESQDTIYYACGETVDKIDMLPQTEAVREKGFEILYFTENVDEFAIRVLNEFEGKKFANICTDDIDLGSEEEKEELKKKNETGKALLDYLRDSIGEGITAVRFTDKLKNHPVCLTTEGEISLEMEKVINSIPQNEQKVKANIVLEINASHPIAVKLEKLYEEDKDRAAKYAKILYAQARLIEGLSVDDPVELSNMVCGLMVE